MENHRAEEEILTVKGLSVSFTQYDRGFGRKEIQAVTDLDLRIPVSYTHLTLPTNSRV